MRNFRRPVTAAAVALGLTAAFVAVPATAADIYHVDIELGAENPDSDRGYPDGIWFTGSSTTGEQTQTEAGLTVTGRTMLLYGAAEIEIESGDHFVELVQSIAVDADGPWSLQLPVYMDNVVPSDYTSYRPATNNTTPGELDSEWILTYDLPGLPADTPVTLQEISDEFDDALEAGVQPALLAYGILVNTTWDDTTIRSFTFDGDTHFFTPEPVVEEPVDPVDPTDPTDPTDPVDPTDPDDDVDPDDDEAPPATPVEDEATFTG